MHSSEQPRNNIFIPLAILVVGALIAGSIYLNRTSVAPQKVTVNAPTVSKSDAFVGVTEKDHILGDATTADIVIVDYSDLECPYCKDLHETFNQIYMDHETDGKIAWVFRHFPLSIHTKSIREAEATECVAELGGNDAFWKYINTIFTNTPSNDGLDPANLVKYATDLNINKEKFNECLSSGKYTQKIKDSFDNSMKLVGAESTPFTVLIVKGKVIPLVDNEGFGFGALPYPTMKALIDEFLKS